MKGSTRTISLGKPEFVGSGGEGEVYAKGGVAFKLYHDPRNIIPEAKVRELAAVHHPHVVKPTGYVIDEQGRDAGVTMPFVADGEPLVGLFVKARRQRLGFTDSDTTGVMEQLREIVDTVHKANVLIVDLNEYNFLVRQPGKAEVWAIDADAWQTPSFPAQVLMPSVRDWLVQHNDWTELSDWYSYAILTFQLWIGVHPYGGQHPALKGMDDRMQAGISVFDSSVKMPRAAAPLATIPGNWLDWYQKLFVSNQRLPPPGVVGTMVAVARQVALPPASLVLDLIIDANAAAVGACVVGGHAWAMTASTIIGRGRRFPLGGQPTLRHYLLAGPDGDPRIAAVGGGQLMIAHPNALGPGSTQSPAMTMEHQGPVAVHRGVLYGLERGTLTGFEVRKFTTLGVALADVAPLATKLYRGCAVQELFGSTWVVLINDVQTAIQVRVKELDGKLVVDAKYEGNVLVVLTADRQGTYDLTRFRFDPATAYAAYDTFSYPGSGAWVDLAVTQRGVAAMVDQNGNLVLFSNRPGSASVRAVDGNGVFHPDTELIADGNDVYVLDRPAGKLFKLSIK